MIKQFSIDEFTECRDLFIKVFNDAPWNNKWTDDTAGDYLKELIDNRRFCGFTLWDNGELVGASFCHLKSYYNGDEMYIDELFISTEHQQKGYGKQIMQEVETYAKDNKLISVTLLTGKENPSYKFFQKYGCKHLESLAFMHKSIK